MAYKSDAGPDFYNAVLAARQKPTLPQLPPGWDQNLPADPYAAGVQAARNATAQPAPAAPEDYVNALLPTKVAAPISSVLARARGVAGAAPYSKAAPTYESGADADPNAFNPPVPFDPDRSPLPAGVTRFNPGRYQQPLNGMDGLPGGPTRRAEVFTGKGAHGEPVFTNNPYDPLLRGVPSNRAGEVASGRAAPDPYNDSYAKYAHENEQDRDAQNFRMMQLQQRFAMMPKSAAEFGELQKNLGEGKAAADNAASKRIEAEAAARKVHLDSDKNTFAATRRGEAIASGASPEEADIVAATANANEGLPDNATPESQTGVAAAKALAAAQTKNWFRRYIFGGEVNDPNQIDLAQAAPTTLSAWRGGGRGFTLPNGQTYGLDNSKDSDRLLAVIQAMRRRAGK